MVGEDFFPELAARFYAGVASDNVLAPLYPEYPDFTGAERRLALFLIQYWGGPATYSIERGHPRLRMRHLPFHIGSDERDRWLAHMSAATVTLLADRVAAGRLDAAAATALRARLDDYFVPSAEHLRNDTGLPITSAAFRAGGGASTSSEAGSR